MTFNDLELAKPLLRAIEELGFDKPTNIQKISIPKILSGVDLLASSKTGSGKTAAFLLPSLMKLIKPAVNSGVGPRILVLVPTRELATQVAQQAIDLVKFMKRAKVLTLFGGVPYGRQLRDLTKPHEIMIATPGRLIDLMNRGKVDFSRLETLILDEADRMLDMGFIKPVEEIAAATPSERQTLLFSATLKGPVAKLAKKLLNNPDQIAAEDENAQELKIEQRLHKVDSLRHKHSILEHILNDPTLQQMLVFTSTKIFADQLADKLISDGRGAASLHGDMKQRERTRTLQALRSGAIQILVATDVAARGIDIPTISHVVNFDLPDSPEDYVHRIGRTGRAGASGVACSFALHKDVGKVRSIETYVGKKLDIKTIPGLEPKNKNEDGPRGPRRGGKPGDRSNGRPRRFNRQKSR